MIELLISALVSALAASGATLGILGYFFRKKLPTIQKELSPVIDYSKIDTVVENSLTKIDLPQLDEEKLNLLVGDAVAQATTDIKQHIDDVLEEFGSDMAQELITAMTPSEEDMKEMQEQMTQLAPPDGVAAAPGLDLENLDIGKILMMKLLGGSDLSTLLGNVPMAPSTPGRSSTGFF